MDQYKSLILWIRRNIKITGFDGYKQVISVINKAVNIGLNIKINVVLTEWTTMEDIQKFIDYMKIIKSVYDLLNKCRLEIRRQR